MDMIRVLLADDEPLIRAGLSTILQASGHITVVGEASTGQQAVTEAQRLHPDVICMDIRMPDGDGLEATRLIQQLDPTPAVIVITTFDLDEYVFGALEAGACGILLKDSPMDALVEGVQRAALGEGLVDAALTRRVITEFTRRKMTPAPSPHANSTALYNSAADSATTTSPANSTSNPPPSKHTYLQPCLKPAQKTACNSSSGPSKTT